MEEDVCKAIRDAVRDGVEEALTKYGISTSDPQAMQADMLYLRKSRTGADEILKWAKRSAITAAITGLLVALWHGIKQLLSSPS
jgi:hypothetical protein